MRSLIAPSAPARQEPPEWLPGLQEALDALLAALVAAVGPSGRAAVDLQEIAERLGLRPLTWRVALCVLRASGRVRVEHDAERFETATVTLLTGDI